MSEAGRTGFPPVALLGTLGAFCLARLVLAAFVGLFEDEAYYWTWSRHLAPAYVDHAPLVAYAIRAGTILAGETELGVRLFGPVAILIGSLALWRAVALASGRSAATAAALAFNVLPIITGGGLVMTPDTPAVLFWGLTLWAVTERIASGNRAWWLAVGLFAGLGLLSKYSGLFMGAGLLLLVLGARDLRRDLLDWRLWAGGAIALALFAPVIWWNAANDWVSFLKQMGRGGRAGGYDPRFLPELAGAIFVLFHPLVVVLAAIGKARWWRRPDRFAAMALLPVATALPFVLYLLWHALFARVQGNWPAPLAISTIMLAAPVLAGAVAPWLDRLRRLVVPSGLAVAVLLALYLPQPFGFAAGEADRTNETRGWPDFAARVAAEARSNGAAWIATTSYGTTASLTWALRADPAAPPVLQLDERIRYGFAPPPDAALIARPALLVERRRRIRTDDLARRFREVGPVVEMERGRLAGTYGLVRLADARGAPLDAADAAAVR